MSRLLAAVLACSLLTGYAAAKTHGTHPPVDSHHAHAAPRRHPHAAGEHPQPPEHALAYHPQGKKAKPRKH